MITCYKEADFKHTPAGKIPQDWSLVNIGQVLALKNGKRPKIVEGGAFPVYGASGVMGYTSDFLVDNDFTIIIGRVGASGEIHLAQGKTWVSDNAIYSQQYDKRMVDPRFIYYLLKFRHLARFASKTTHPIITQSFLNVFPIQLPPRQEQHRIGGVLSVVDELIQKAKEVVSKSEYLKKGLMQELLTKGIGHHEFKDNEIGRIPKEWKVVKLGDAITYKKGIKPKTLLTQQDRDTLPYLTADVIRTGVFTQWARQIDEFVKVNKDDVILIWDGFYCGDAFIGFEGILSSTMIKIKPKPGFDKHFLFYLLKTHFKELNTKISGMYLKHVSKSVFEALKLPLPLLAEQQKIAEILSTVDEKLKLERNEKARLEKIRRGLMDLLLTGTIRVKVN